MKNQKMIIIIVAFVVGGTAFFGGMQYQKTKNSNNPMPGQFRMLNGRGPNMQGMQPVSGEIISYDETSITVKMPDGSSKIVILSGNTIINKSTEGTKEDLHVGERVTAFGTTNTDGSVNAQNISIGGAMMFRERTGAN